MVMTMTMMMMMMMMMMMTMMTMMCVPVCSPWNYGILESGDLYPSERHQQYFFGFLLPDAHWHHRQ